MATQPFFRNSLCFFLLIFSFNLPAEEGAFTFEHETPVLSGVPFALTLRSADSTFSGYVTLHGLSAAPMDSVGPFTGGACTLPKVLLKKAGEQVVTLNYQGNQQPVTIRAIPGFLSLLPPLLAILLALIFRQVLISLFAGVWLGALFLNGFNPFLGLLRLLDHYLINSLADADHAPIVLFSLTLGGMVGILSRSGGTQGIVRKLSKMAENPRGGQLASWAMGLFIFFDDYANTLIVGNTMRPITDRVKISREKLAYIVDSTAAPVVSAALISTWIGFELGLIQSTFHMLGIERNVYFTFIQTIPFRFYSLLTIVFVFLIAFSKRDFGPMLKAERRARNTGKVLRDNCVPLADKHLSEITAPEDAPLRWINAVLPIATVILVALLGLWYNGRTALLEQGIATPTLKMIIGNADSFAVLMWASFAGTFMAGLLAISQKILSLRDTVDAWISGAKAMLLAVIILVFAWSIGQICKDLHTADFLVNATRGYFSPHMLPLITFILAALTSFATGTSWGTMSILVPIVVPMAWHFAQDAGMAPEKAATVLTATIASVLSGAVFGDHCSPISDTTIMSSMASGADHIDHVRTQIPYAVTVGVISMAVGYIPAGFGLSPLISLPVGVVLLIGAIMILGKKS